MASLSNALLSVTSFHPTTRRVTGQMTFDSHVLNLVDVAARLVNAAHARARRRPRREHARGRRSASEPSPRRSAAAAVVRRPSPPGRPTRSPRTPCRCARSSRRSTAATWPRRRACSTRCSSAPAPDPSSTRSPRVAGTCTSTARPTPGHRLGGRLRHRPGAGHRQRPGGPARRLRGRPVRPGLRRHVEERQPAVLLDDLPEPDQGSRVPAATRDWSRSHPTGSAEPIPSASNVLPIARPMATYAGSSTGSSRSGPSVKTCTVSASGGAGQQHAAVVTYAADGAGLVGEGRLVAQGPGQRVAVPLLLEHRSGDGVPGVGDQPVDRMRRARAARPRSARRATAATARSPTSRSAGRRTGPSPSAASATRTRRPPGRR